jgi:hypothetical protein
MVGEQTALPTRKGTSKMKKTILAVAAVIVSAAGFTGAAHACKPGYKSVKIQGNWICAIDASASNTLATQQPVQPKKPLAVSGKAVAPR